jgi:hypothetical protein
MNCNTTVIANSDPITRGAAKVVGDIMRHIGENDPAQESYADVSPSASAWQAEGAEDRSPFGIFVTPAFFCVIRTLVRGISVPTSRSACGDHFSWGVLVLRGGYFARSARHFFASSGLLSAVYSSISRSRASGMRVLPSGGMVFSRAFIPS